MTDKDNDRKRKRLGFSVSMKMIRWLRDNRPDHMTRSIATEHYFWLGIEAERRNNALLDLKDRAARS